MARHLTAAQVDEALTRMKARDGEWVSRGRGGEGFVSRDGRLYRKRVEEMDEEEWPVGEAELRAYLAGLDLDDYSQRYPIWALQQLGLALDGPPLP